MGNRARSIDPTPFALARKFTSPTGTVEKGVRKTETEWMEYFPQLMPGDCRIKRDWFTPKPEKLSITDLSPGDTVAVSPKVIAADFHGNKYTTCTVNDIRPDGHIEVLYGSYMDSALVKLEHILEILEKYQYETYHKQTNGAC